MRHHRHALALIATVAPVVGIAQTASQKPPAPGSACVALAVPSVQGVDGDATSFAMAVRDLFASYLKGPSVRTVSLESRLASQAALEARDKDCGQMLLVTVEHKRSGGSKLGSFVGQAAGTAVSRAPVGGGVTGAVVGGATSATGTALYTFASGVHAKDELELSYRLGPPDGVDRVKPATSKAKAKSDREDLLTPLVENAANAIVTAMTGGR